MAPRHVSRRRLARGRPSGDCTDAVQARHGLGSAAIRLRAVRQTCTFAVRTVSSVSSSSNSSDMVASSAVRLSARRIEDNTHTHTRTRTHTHTRARARACSLTRAQKDDQHAHIHMHSRSILALNNAPAAAAATVSGRSSDVHSVRCGAKPSRRTHPHHVLLHETNKQSSIGGVVQPGFPGHRRRT